MTIMGGFPPKALVEDELGQLFGCLEHTAVTYKIFQDIMTCHGDDCVASFEQKMIISDYLFQGQLSNYPFGIV